MTVTDPAELPRQPALSSARQLKLLLDRERQEREQEQEVYRQAMAASDRLQLVVGAGLGAVGGSVLTALVLWWC